MGPKGKRLRSTPYFSVTRMPAAASHRRTPSATSLLTAGEATEREDSQDPPLEEEPELLEILSNESSPTTAAHRSDIEHQAEAGKAHATASTIEIAVSAISPPRRRDTAGPQSPRSGASFDRRFPLLLCASCACCTIMAFVLVAVWGGAQGRLM